MYSGQIRQGIDGPKWKLTAFSLIVVSLSVFILSNIMLMIVNFGTLNYSQVLTYRNIRIYLGYIYASVIVAAGIALLMGYNKMKISKRVIYIMGSILLMLSFIPLLLENPPVMIWGLGQPPSIGVFQLFFISTVVFSIVVYKLSFLLIGSSLFRNYRFYLLIPGVVFGVANIIISNYASYSLVASELTGGSSLLTPGLSTSYFVSVVLSSEILGILSIACFLIVFSASIAVIMRKPARPE